MDKKNLSNSSKQGKKAALVCSCRGSPRDIVEKYATWTVSGFSQIGATDTRGLVFDGIPRLGEIRNREDYIQQLHKLAVWLTK